jgi:ectoine hydroxylase-related dioxygenase (phytanoyl-CoA dioxygenase family)
MARLERRSGFVDGGEPGAMPDEKESWSDMATTRKLRRVPKSTPNEDIVKIVAEDGAVVIEQFIPADVVDAFRAEMAPYISARPPGPPEFLGAFATGDESEVDQGWGHNTVRLTMLISRSETLRTKIISDEKLFDLARRQLANEHFWMSTAQVIYIGPGSLPQILHRDLENYPVFSVLGRSGPEVTCNAIFAISDFTVDNGATRVIPGSNTWDDYSERKEQTDTIPAEMKKGDALFFSGKVLHGGGGNTTKDEWRFGLAVAFCAPYLMPEEALPLTIDPQMAKTLPRHVQQMTGFRSFDLDNGARLWTADYESLAKHLEFEE